MKRLTNKVKNLSRVFLGALALELSGCALNNNPTPLEARIKLGLLTQGQNLFGMGHDIVKVGDYYLRKIDYNNLVLFYGETLKKFKEQNKTDDNGVLRAMDYTPDYVITSEEMRKFLEKYR